MQREESSVVIIGAGPVGLAAALRCAYGGVRSVVVLEKRDINQPLTTDSNQSSFRDVFSRSNIFQLSYWTLKQLEALGVEQDDPALQMSIVDELCCYDYYGIPNDGSQTGMDPPRAGLSSCMYKQLSSS